MKDLIIGYKGFVGSNLKRIYQDAEGAGRKDMSKLAGIAFDTVYCAAPQAKKWWANKNPEEDKNEITNLLDSCRHIKCKKKFVLFSTVDVYDPPEKVDEQTEISNDIHPYGSNRLFLEQKLTDTFGDKILIVRLPALVGEGLKKNVIFDFLNDNNVDKVNPNSKFQWFNLSFIDEVLDFAIATPQINVLNVATEPLDTSIIVDNFFPNYKPVLNWDLKAINYDVKTIHSKTSTGYLYSADVSNCGPRTQA